MNDAQREAFARDVRFSPLSIIGPARVPSNAVLPAIRAFIHARGPGTASAHPNPAWPLLTL